MQSSKTTLSDSVQCVLETETDLCCSLPETRRLDLPDRLDSTKNNILVWVVFWFWFCFWFFLSRQIVSFT